MNSALGKLKVLLVLLPLSIPSASAQKVQTGYDKGADFSSYKSFTLVEPPTPSSMPLLYASVVGSIKNELQSRGLASLDHDGDLTVLAAGGIDYGLGGSPTGVTGDSCKNCQTPQRDVQYWAGFLPPSGSAGKPRPKGTLELNFVDRKTNKVVWTGAVSQKLDPNKKEQALQKVAAAINKLIAEFPPKK